MRGRPRTSPGLVHARRRHPTRTEPYLPPSVGRGPVHGARTAASSGAPVRRVPCRGRRETRHHVARRDTCAQTVVAALGAVSDAGETGPAAWFRRWAGPERAAVSPCSHERRLVPGLLRSKGYVRALCENEIPPLSDDVLEATVQVRLERQQLLRERPRTTFDFVIEEAVLMRRWGGTQVAAERLDLIPDPEEVSRIHMRCARLRPQELSPKDSMSPLMRI
ncbi:Scr1 family TA system antitoxin-like transcriptional regulator [Streptomyces sp. NPDC126497]|uniref:Scr1 family TA system antitoxin-like transcriptional regulator n=1 Tax=Streptomyces sp. NPDC126497 TaxID=3155313 RepID=UPI00332C83F9